MYILYTSFSYNLFLDLTNDTLRQFLSTLQTTLFSKQEKVETVPVEKAAFVISTFLIFAGFCIYVNFKLAFRSIS